MSQEILDNGLPQTYRFITDHNTDGKAIFSKGIDEIQPKQQLDGGVTFALNYTTSRFPVSFQSNQDIAEYQNFLKEKPGLVIPGGSVLRIVDMPPGTLSPMHRTISLDYGVVLEGEVFLELDSGEKRVMRRGDVSIQRGTNHAWRNTSETEWARMMYVLLEAEPLQINGERLTEEYGSMPKQVRPSG